jgi:PHD/YefM family antitoxin component YafN of YafNO toxin-antitoxin module
MRVSSAEFIKNYGAVSDSALKEPVTITRNGRDRLVLVSADEYQRLKRRDRRAVSIEDITEEDLKLIEASEMEPGHEHLDKELEGWRP